MLKQLISENMAYWERRSRGTFGFSSRFGYQINRGFFAAVIFAHNFNDICNSDVIISASPSGYALYCANRPYPKLHDPHSLGTHLSDYLGSGLDAVRQCAW